MSKLEIVNYILDLVTANEMDKAKAVILQKQKEVRQNKVRNLRIEISEIIKTMNQIDMELMQFKLKKLQLARLCPDTLMKSIDHYMADLQQQRKQLSMQKSKIAKQYSK